MEGWNMRCGWAAYCRVSTDKEDQLHSLAAQQAYFEGYIARHRLALRGHFRRR